MLFLVLNRGTQSQPQNIMYDKRVIRGSNYSQPHMQVVSIAATSHSLEHSE